MSERLDAVEPEQMDRAYVTATHLKSKRDKRRDVAERTAGGRGKDNARLKDVVDAAMEDDLFLLFFSFFFPCVD